MANQSFEDDFDSAEAMRGRRLHHPAAAERARKDADKRNLEIIQNDQILQRILTRYRCLDSDGRAELARLAEAIHAPDVSEGGADGT